MRNGEVGKKTLVYSTGGMKMLRLLTLMLHLISISFFFFFSFPVLVQTGTGWIGQTLQFRLLCGKQRNHFLFIL